MVVGEVQACLSTGEKTTGIVRLTEVAWRTAGRRVRRPGRRRHLAGSAVEARDLSAAVDDVGIERIGGDVAVLVDADRQPVADRIAP